MTASQGSGPQSLIDRRVVDRAGKKVGSVGQVFVDDRTGEPAWITVNTGVFGMTENFVPLVGTKLAGRSLMLPFAKAAVKGSPTIEDASHLDIAEERALYAHYSKIDPPPEERKHVTTAIGAARAEQERKGMR